MDLPFTTEQFLDVFRNYNEAIWPAQIVAYILGFSAVFGSLKLTVFSDRVISAILAVFWVWEGAMYHMVFFSSINRAAWLFGALFILQGVLFFVAGVVKNGLTFRFKTDVYGLTGAFFILYAMVIYPIIGSILGHGYPYAPVFGVAPCPTTIFTFGLLLWTRSRVSRWILVIPVLWSLVGLIAALALGIKEDFMLIVAGVVGAALLINRDRKKEIEPELV